VLGRRAPRFPAICQLTELVAERRPQPPRAGPLATYRGKRDFSETSEPAGEAQPAAASAVRRFVVQRHRAGRLHYDFRLEIDGVLVSWAVPKGPTLDPRARRAAFHVEDHPLEYFDFEGVIPAGQYGGGDVIVWDDGTWQLDEAGGPGGPGHALEAGELHLDLQGRKLRGRFLLVRTRTGVPGKEQWLLLHKRDEHAVDGWDPEAHPRSVLSGRTNDEVKARPEHVALGPSSQASGRGAAARPRRPYPEDSWPDRPTEVAERTPGGARKRGRRPQPR
jgi:bifunctional non-homologous end joining protein LigD